MSFEITRRVVASAAPSTSSRLYCFLCVIFYTAVIISHVPTAVDVVEFSPLFVCLFVCLFVFPHDISETDTTRITKLDVEMTPDESWKPIYLRVRRSRSRVTETLPAWSLHSCECWLSGELLCVTEAGSRTLRRWESSLMVYPSSVSRVALHLAVLDSCVAWSRSVLNARCNICRRSGNAELMLLCDGCDRGFHMFCLKRPLKVCL